MHSAFAKRRGVGGTMFIDFEKAYDQHKEEYSSEIKMNAHINNI